MKRYEYKTLMTDFDITYLSQENTKLGEFEKTLNEMGDAGWELVESVSISRYEGKTHYILSVFRREITM